MMSISRWLQAAARGCSILLLPLLFAAGAEAAKAPTLKARYNRTPVKAGAKTVALLSKGAMVKATSKRGEWFGVRVKVNGKWLNGWVHKSHVQVLDAAAALEAEAQKAFEELKAKAQKLAEEGKFRDAIAVMDTFPPRFWNTDVQNQVREYALTLEEEANKPEHLEPEAERAFAELKEKADKLVEEGKIEDAIATMQRFPAKYSETTFGEQAEARVLELQRKLNAPMPEADQQAIVDLVREKKYDDAVARIETVVKDGMKADSPHVLAAKVYVQNHRIAAGTPDQLGEHILAADPYISDPAFHGNLANLRKVVAPPGKEQLTFRMNFGLIAIEVPTQSQVITFGKHVAEHYHWSPYVRMACGRVLARAAFDSDGEGKDELVDKAAERYRQAIMLDLFHSPVSLDATAELARLLIRDGRHDDAIAACRTALERFPDDFVVLTALGQAHQAAGHPDEAAAAWEKSLKANPLQPRLASALQKLKGTPTAALAPPR